MATVGRTWHLGFQPVQKTHTIQANLGFIGGIPGKKIGERLMSKQAKSIVAWIIIGLIAGALASLVVGSGSGLIGYTIAGLIGSVVGGFLAQQLKIKLNLGTPFLEQVIVAFVGAIIVLVIANVIT